VGPSPGDERNCASRKPSSVTAQNTAPAMNVAGAAQAIPKQPRARAGREQGDAAQQFEGAESSAAQLGRGGSGNHRCEQALQHWTRARDRRRTARPPPPTEACRVAHAIGELADGYADSEQTTLAETSSVAIAGIGRPGDYAERFRVAKAQVWRAICSSSCEARTRTEHREASLWRSGNACEASARRARFDDRWRPVPARRSRRGALRCGRSLPAGYVWLRSRRPTCLGGSLARRTIRSSRRSTRPRRKAAFRSAKMPRGTNRT